MPLIIVDELSYAYGEKQLFANINFTLNRGDKVALVAANGSGKSTLLKIVAGIEEADDGKITPKKDLSIAYLRQDPEFSFEGSINDLLQTDFTDVLKTIRQYEMVVADHENDPGKLSQMEMDRAMHEMDKLNAWDYERQLKEMLTRLNISRFDQPLQTLSGGQKKRLALAFVLLENADVLLLDEPTNHLDIEMIEWLEAYLIKTSAAILMVTHDRYFLDRVCTRILELDNTSLYQYDGNYDYFLTKKSEREENLETEVMKARQLAKKELEWLRRMPKARTHKSKARINAYYQTKKIADKKINKEEINLDINMKRLGGKIIELKQVAKAFGEIQILQHFDYIFKKGERIGILGKNGVGKSTFLKILSGEINPDQGTVVQGETLEIGHFSQLTENLKDHKSVLDSIREIAEVVQMEKGQRLSASQFLNHFMFTPQMQINPVGNLSGGEKRRLQLLTVLMKNPNFLILDEPTNDLDLVTLGKLEEFLMNFSGCLVIVSHDRFFLDRLADHLFIFEGDGVIRDFYGNYADYKLVEEEKQHREKEALEQEKVNQQSNDHSSEKKKTRLSYKEKNEYESLEQEIEQLEIEKNELEKNLINPELCYTDITKISNRMGELIKLIDDKTFRWMELDEIKQELGK